MNDIIFSELEKNSEYSRIRELLTGTGNDTVCVNGICRPLMRPFLRTVTADLMSDDRNVMIVCATDIDAASYCDYLISCGIDALYYPSRDYNFTNAVTSRDYENYRLEVLGKLFGNKGKTVICTGLVACLQKTIDRERFRQYSLVIDHSSEIDTEKLSSDLIRMGYTRVSTVEGIGQFAVRGGIIDVYSTDGNPYRIELFGDEIDRIGYFATDSQRSTGNVDGCAYIFPAHEIITDSETVEMIRNCIDRTEKYIMTEDDSIGSEKERKLQMIHDASVSLLNDTDICNIDLFIPSLSNVSTSLIENFDGALILTDPSKAEKEFDNYTKYLKDEIHRFYYGLSGSVSYGFLYDYENIGRMTDRNVCLVIDSFINRYDFKVDHRAEITSKSDTLEKKNIISLTEILNRNMKDGVITVVFCGSDRRKNGLLHDLIESRIAVADIDGTKKTGNDPSVIYVTSDEIREGFLLGSSSVEFVDFSISVYKKKRRTKRGFGKFDDSNTRKVSFYTDLKEGDYVVHAEYGIGIYRGLQNITVAGISRDYISIQYAGSDKLFMPVDQLDNVYKYINLSSDSSGIRLSSMGNDEWKRKRSKAKKIAEDIAKDLLELYRKRNQATGISFYEDDEMAADFASTFPYEETDGQMSAIEDVRRDMESVHPMNRLICGDVGYGKTEVALRAAFKAVLTGKQVAVLVPSTILAMQHYNTFVSRMSQFPVKVEMLSRMVPARQVTNIRKRLREGDVDILIGTHMILSDNTEYRDLGLIVIDEEQKFGVKQKEKLKKKAINADILTLTATPIPRTMNMALGGLVDMSMLEEAPENRKPVKTFVMEYDPETIKDAINRELRRSGQVYYLYNRIDGIYNCAAKVQRMFPDARIEVAHGRMDEDHLEDVWTDLRENNIDILVCTSLIESGVDVPNVNTLIIENADRYGLSQLHQIRGRIGRSERRAYAYLTYKKNKEVSDTADRRLRTISEFTEFGSGYKIAMRDLEIRGAGNILGAEQHGQIESVGYDLFMKLINESVQEAEGKTVEEKKDCSIDVKVSAFIPNYYIEEPEQRIDIYKKISQIENEENYDDIIDELCDRFGEPSKEVLNLCRIAYLKSLAIKCGIKKVKEELEKGIISFEFYELGDEMLKKIISCAGIFNLSGSNPENRIIAVKLTDKNKIDYVSDFLEMLTEK